MSIYIMVPVFRAEGLNAHEKLVALSLADNANDDGTQVRPSLNTTAQKTALSKSTVQRVIKTLIAKRVIEVEEKATFTTPVVYRFLMTHDLTALSFGDSSQRDYGESSQADYGGVSGTSLGLVSVTPESIEIDTDKKKSTSTLETRAAAIYDTYPRKVDRARAIRVIVTQLRNGASDVEMFSAVANYAATKIDSEPEFIKHAATFFRDSWREWVFVADRFGRSVQRVPDVNVHDVEQRHEESVAPPKDFAKNIRKQLLPGGS